MTPAFRNLKSATETLVAAELDYNKLRTTLSSLKELFHEAAGFEELEESNKQDIMTISGKAIAPSWAASCLDDMMRTRNFILGIKSAIEERLKLNPRKPVTVLYAGTGPFATLLTPLITVFSPEQLKMVLMEIHPQSIRYLQKIIRHFDMEKYLIEVIQADAVMYHIPQHQQPDILVSETMNNALQKEPQVSIVANLISQCIKEPILIPELIKVDACLIGNPSAIPQPVHSLETLLELDAKMAMQIKNCPETVKALSSGVEVLILTKPGDSYTQLALCTHIRVFREYEIGINESGLTIPHILQMVNSIKKYPYRLLFQYKINDNPGFRIVAN